MVEKGAPEMEQETEASLVSDLGDENEQASLGVGQHEEKRTRNRGRRRWRREVGG
jgi:hypothetical protein